MDQFSDELDVRLARLAMAQGRLTGQQLQQAKSEQQRTGARLNDVLVNGGWLSASICRRLMLELSVGNGSAVPGVSRTTPERPPESDDSTPTIPPQAAVNGTDALVRSPDSPSSDAEALPPLPSLDAEGGAPPTVSEQPDGNDAEEDWGDAASFLRPISPPEEAALSQQNDITEDDWADLGDLPAPTPGIVISESAYPASSPQQLRMQIDLLLAVAEKEGASDLHLHADQPVMMRVNGKLLVAETDPITADELRAALIAILDADARATFERNRDVDFAYVTASGLRTRSSICQQQGGVDGVFRLIPRSVRTLAEIGAPEDIARFTHYHAGLVLVTGPAGSGKTTTLNSLIDIVNDTRDDHILTVEDPIEFVHKSKHCLVNQRQVRRHTESFARALRAALREDPDVIVIGELRDLETISLAVTAAETGHLVIGSLHTSGATRTISRILDVFPPEQQGQIRAMVSESLRGVVSQKLIPAVDGTRAAAFEVLVVTPAISNLIRDDKMHQLRSAMQVGRPLGMRLLDDSIRELVASGRVAPDVAKRYMDAPPPAAVSSAPTITSPGGIPAVSPAATQSIPPVGSRSMPGVPRANTIAPGQLPRRPPISKV